MKKKVIDEKDVEILKILEQDASITNRNLAVKIGLSPPPTLVRVQNLITNGVISGYTIKVNTDFFRTEHREMVEIMASEATIQALTARAEDENLCVHISQSEPHEMTGMVTLWMHWMFSSIEQANNVLKGLVKDLTVIDIKRRVAKRVSREWQTQVSMSMVKDL